MRKIAYTTLAAAAVVALSSGAHAQDSTFDEAEITVGPSVGLHDLNVDLGDLDPDDGQFEDFAIDDSAEIYGGFAAVDVPLGESLFVGAEGNLHFGSGPIEAEYGVSARLGLRTEGGAKIYARGGYQWVDLDLENLTGVSEDFLDDTGVETDDVGGDYLVGAGVEFPVGAFSLRANVDTIAFDTLRGTVGLGFRF